VNPVRCEWVTLPDYNLEEIKLRIASGDDEERAARIADGEEDGDEVIIISDEGFPFKVRVNEDLDELNEFAELVEDANDEQEILAAAYVMDDCGNDLDDIIRKIKHREYACYDSWTDLGESLVDEGMFGNVDDKLKTYIDYERLGEDCRHDGYTEVEEYGRKIIYLYE
jgi:hypothetical protein